MLTLVLFLILVWMVLGILGFVIKGLLWLFVIACVLFAATMLVSAFTRGRRGHARAR